MFTSTFIPERECFRVVADTDNGPISKLLSIGDYQKFIESVFASKSVTPKDLGVIEPLPSEFLRARFDPLSASGVAAYRLSAGSYPVFYRPDEKEAKSYLVHFPDTLWHVHVTRGVVSNIHLFCVFDKEITDSTILWRLPLSNVYSDGRICLGGNKWKFRSLSDFRVLTNEFFSAPHENALYNPAEFGMPLNEMFPLLEKEGITTCTAKPCGTYGECIQHGLLSALA